MKTACLLKRLRKIFPDARWITIDTERSVNRHGQIELIHSIHIKLTCGATFDHESNSINEIIHVAEYVINMAEDFELHEEKTLTVNQVFRAFAKSRPSSFLKVD